MESSSAHEVGRRAHEAFEVPTEASAPIKLTTPRIGGVSFHHQIDLQSDGTKSPGLHGLPISSGLLCTPGRTSMHFEGQEEYAVDLHLKQIQLALAEQRTELSRVAETYEIQINSLCRAMCAACRHWKEPRMQNTVADIVLPSEGHDSTCSPRDSRPTHVQHRGGADKHNTWTASMASIFSTPDQKGVSLYDDSISAFRQVRGWLEPTVKQKEDLIKTLRTIQIGSANVTCLQRLVNHSAFDTFSCVIILSDAVLTGAIADHGARNIDDDVPKIFDDIQVAFLILYCSELLIRFAAERSGFFFSGWNIFDSALVGMDVLAKIYTIASGEASAFEGTAALRMSRMLRLLRAFRIFRVLRFLRELRMMVKCIMACSKTVVWVLMLMCLNIYVFSVYLTGQVSAAFRDGVSMNVVSQGILERRFGTVTDAGFALFMAISGGISWVDFTDPLISIHWTNGLVVVFYIFLTTFAMLNIITGVFVDSAMTAGRTDEEELVQDIIEDERSSLQKIKQLFTHVDRDADDHVTYDELENHMASPEARILFKSIGIGVQEVKGLYKLLDTDGSGYVTLDEFITGCMRLREGSYNSLDLSTLLYENKRMMSKFKGWNQEIKKQFTCLHEHISQFEMKLSELQA